MYKKIIKQNKTFLSIVIILLIFFGSVIYFGAKQIYEREAKWRHGKDVALLRTAKEIVNVFFTNFKNDLFFLRDISSTKCYINKGFDSIKDRNEVKELFYEFAKNYNLYYQIRIIDSSGDEIVRIENKQEGSTTIVPESELQNKKNRYYFHETMKLNMGQIYASSIDLNIEQDGIETHQVPVVRLATPLFDSKDRKRGILIFNMYFSRILEILPENIFFQTEDGNQISLQPDGSINFNKSNYNLSGNSGWLDVSEVETIHYSIVQFLTGNRLVVGIYHNHPGLKAALQKLMLVSVIISSLFFGLITIIGYLRVLRFRELIKAQKAIIYSLAGLAEGRDPETGHHLKRTRNYSVALAKELRNNKKYIKIITGEFIEDLYDAVPLHDIGKVGIRDSILLKKENLTKEEYEEMKKHVLIGKQVLQDGIDRFKLKQTFLIMGRNICAYHQEKYNGKGYPEGLKGDEIPLEVRIFSLVDAYDAIRSKRPYKDKLSHEEAVIRIKSESSNHFDPDIVDAFLRCDKEFLGISETFRY